MGPFVRITALSIKFSSSLMFPGQSHRVRARMMSGGIVSIFLFSRRECLSTKYRTSSGMSSRRSRKGGIVIGKTLRRYYRSLRNSRSATIFVRSRFVAATNRTLTGMVWLLPSLSNSFSCKARRIFG